MGKVLLVDCKKSALKNVAANDGDFVIFDFKNKDDQVNLHEAAKSSETILICSDRNTNGVIADDIWHMLRNKIVLSASRDLSLNSLRDMYPLSKVARCSMGLDEDSDKSLILICNDNDFTDNDLERIKALFEKIGEALFINEELFEKILVNLEQSTAVLVKLIAALKKNATLEHTMYEYVLGWMLYEIGSSTLKGKPLDEILPIRDANSDEKINRLVSSIMMDKDGQ